MTTTRPFFVPRAPVPPDLVVQEISAAPPTPLSARPKSPALKLPSALIAPLLHLPMISANIFTDWWGKITGRAAFDNANLNITVGNSPPTIPFVQVIAAQSPTEASTTSITFNFTARDTDGVANLNDSTAQARFNKTGEATRSNLSCVGAGTSGNDKNYTCTIDMWYFDGNGAWTINVTIKDNAAASAENSSQTFTFNLLTAMVMSPNSLTWPTINPPDTNVEANQNITVNNTGNDFDLNINIIAYNLRGESDTSKFIFANNFTVSNETQGTCTATEMVNGTSTNVTSSILQRGNNSLNYWNATSGQEQIVFCIKGIPPEATAQPYSSSFFGPWQVTVLLVVLIPAANRKRKKKLKKSNKILKLLIRLTDELRREYSKEKEIVVEQLIKAITEEYGIKRKEVLNLVIKEVEIPITIFSKELGALETLAKYMKENLNMSYKEISEKLNRNERTIWTAYKKATEKQKTPFEIKEARIMIPKSIFENRKLTTLESIVLYLKEKGFKFSEIAQMLERDQRNIWTTYSKAKKKIIDRG